VGVVVEQPFARVPAVDEPEVGRGLIEAEQFLKALRKLADLAGIGAEGVCLTRRTAISSPAAASSSPPMR
jgi:hypothetical protein